MRGGEKETSTGSSGLSNVEIGEEEEKIDNHSGVGDRREGTGQKPQGKSRREKPPPKGDLETDADGPYGGRMSSGRPLLEEEAKIKEKGPPAL